MMIGFPARRPRHRVKTELAENERERITLTWHHAVFIAVHNHNEFISGRFWADPDTRVVFANQILKKRRLKIE